MSVDPRPEPLEPGRIAAAKIAAAQLLRTFDRIPPQRLRSCSDLDARSRFSTTRFWSPDLHNEPGRLDSLMGAYQGAALLLSRTARAEARRWLSSLDLSRFVDTVSWIDGGQRRGFEFVPVAAQASGRAPLEPAAFRVWIHDFYRPLVDAPRVAAVMSTRVPMRCTVVAMPARAPFPMSGWEHATADVERRLGYAFVKHRSIPRVLLQGPGLFDAAVQWYRLSLHDDVLRVEMFFLASPRFQGVVDVGGRDPGFDWIERHAPRAWSDAFRERVDRTMVGHHCAVHDRVVGEWLDRQLRGSASAERRRGRSSGVRRSWSSRPAAVTASTRELRNKQRVYRLVDSTRSILRITSSLGPAELAPLVRRALALGSYDALWALEGLGRVYADDAWPTDAPGQDRGPRLASAGGVDALPGDSRIMLHAGLGLSLARRMLARLDGRATEAAARHEVGAFVRRCGRRSLDGYASAALESLGLVTRVFHRRLVAVVVAAIRVVAPEIEGAFWHGLGRALYFTPRRFVPASAWSAVQAAVREGGHGDPRHNAVAGIAWALTLVNQRHPEVLARLVVGPYGSWLLGEPGFAHGVESAVRVRELTTPGAGFARAFAAYRPSDPLVCEPALWDAVIGAPARRAMQRTGVDDTRTLFEYDARGWSE